MPRRVCERCGRSFAQGAGRPAKRCPECRPGGGRYGGEHRKLAAATKGQAWGRSCTRCGWPLVPGQEIHLDHADGGGPADYRGWSHAHCNTSAAASKGRVNGTPARAAAAGPARPSGPLPRHAADCACGGAVTWPGPRGFWTSRCWFG